jgi:biopolymer transport protein ExbB
VPQLLEAWHATRDFVDAGGAVLTSILITTLLMWTLIIERYWYLRTEHRHAVELAREEWHARRERASWHAHQIRRAVVSRISIDLQRTIPLIKTLVAVCPLLGLLGTVTGMVEVFDVMAIAGSGNPRAMASGVAHATIPTMAGMVAALSGLVFAVQLERRARMETDRIADQLSPEG